MDRFLGDDGRNGQPSEELVRPVVTQDLCRQHRLDQLAFQPSVWMLLAQFVERRYGTQAQDGVSVEYVAGDRCWTQTFTTMRLDEAELAAALDAAGLRLDRYLTEDRSWFRAVPVATEG